MAIRKNADGSITVGILVEAKKPVENKPKEDAPKPKRAKK